MMWTATYPTIEDCHVQGAWDLMMTRERDDRVTDRAFYYDTMFQISNPFIPMNLYMSAYKKPDQRWCRFLREYIDENYESFLGRCLDIYNDRGVKTLAYNFPTFADHKLGNCIQLLMVRLSRKKPPHLTLVSRMSEWFPVSPLDLSLLSTTAAYLQKRIDPNIESFVAPVVTASWYLSCLVINRYKALYLKTYKDWEYTHDPHMSYWMEAYQKFPKMREGGYAVYRQLGISVDNANDPEWKEHYYYPGLPFG